ncbi:MAG: Cys/Met metabolism pyridoxal-phosphate-dependent protein [Solirubrobacterales bacterium]|nr:Cys/Met metabolism pyridoxal-phosphate-dependent protein [Solirubrobacterales bacterium]
MCGAAGPRALLLLPRASDYRGAMLRSEDVKPQTWAIVGGRPDGNPGAPLNTPLVPASAFVLGGERIYSRNEATEGWESFEALVGGLEGGSAVAFASGMAACAAVLGRLPSGAHLVLGDDCYQGVAGLAQAGARDHGWRVERLPVADPGWVAKAAEADLLWVESPSNPLLDVADVAAICGAPRRPGTRVVVDNTFATPLGQQPLVLGADVVVHSATKFIGGHSDLLLGVAVTADPDELALLRTARGLNGATPGTLECFLALRGARTLPLRLAQASASAAQLVQRLGEHPAVHRVRYPGFGGVVSFELADAAAADRACRSVTVIRHATSLGGVETTMERRNAQPGQEHIPAGLIRMSVGCEDIEDVWRDLEGALRP